MINYPKDIDIQNQAKNIGLSEVVLVRDIVRVVEVLNLKERNFFKSNSVLAGSMALRCFGSPRFTVFDVDLSTSTEVVNPPEYMTTLLTYHDDNLDIVPARMVSGDKKGSIWESRPIAFDPVFTSLIPEYNDRQFKADVSFRGLVLPSIERPLSVPYHLELWKGEHLVQVMDPHEVLAEKILGWCAHRGVKHYADLAFITLAASQQIIKIDWRKARDTLADKLTVMSTLHPEHYQRFSHIDALVGDLSKEPYFEPYQWQGIMYIRSEKDRFTQQFITKVVRQELTVNLRKAAPR